MLKQRHFGLIVGCLLALSLLPSQAGRALSFPSMSILSPGDGSVVSPPIYLKATLNGTQPSLIRVTLIDRSGNLLARQLLRSDSATMDLSLFETSLAYEIASENMPVLLTLTSLDSANRPIAARSVSLVLITDGESDIHDPAMVEPWITLSEPGAGSTIRGGKMVVKGTVTPMTDKPIIFELVTNSGGVVGSSQLAVSRAGETVDFTINLTYAFITSLRNARLVIRQTMDPFGVNANVESLPLYLLP